MALYSSPKLRRYFLPFWCLGGLLLCGCQPNMQKTRQAPEHNATGSEQSAPVILSINDVYQLKGLYEGRVGGLPRVLTLRKQLRDTGHPVILLHAGDFLHPSFVSRVFKGQAMIDSLNRLDGSADTFDPLMFVTFGNHEFDKGKLKHASTLQQRIDASEFTWLDSNIRWQHDANGQPLIRSKNLKKWAIVEVPGPQKPIRLGLFSITTAMAHPEYIEGFDSPAATAAKYVPLLRQKGADFVVALTHQSLSRDKKLLQLPEKSRPDIVFGGHEHYHQLENINGRWIAKADADAVSAIVAPLERMGGRVSTQPTLVELDESVPPDSELLAVANAWLDRLSDRYCAGIQQPPGCLEQAYGKTQVKLIGEESEIRRFETNLGDFIADTALQAFAACGADMATLNSGGIRLNQNIAAGSPITSGHLEAMFAYPSPLKLIRISGKTLKQMLAHDIDKWTANGHWLLISGFRFTHDPEKQQFFHLTHTDGRPVTDEEEILLVVPDYLISPRSDHDGYTMINDSMVVDCPINGTQLKDLLIQRLRQHPEGIAPRTDGRICNTLRSNCPQ
jgi:2',3'-cyclic-nucleotide 2'-phosphodiesterase (5'-nucleotidase family)